MKHTTDLYYKARIAGAKPLLLAYVGSNLAVRCFGKETPPGQGDSDLFFYSQVFFGTDAVYFGTDAVYFTSNEAASLDFDVYDWQARVLTFGDYRESLTDDADNIIASYNDQEMSTYTLSCDNADSYFSELCGKEEFLGGQLLLFQGFDYPGFAFSDYIPLFSGTISDVTLTTLEYVFLADTSVKAISPDDPTITTEIVYAVSNAGVGATAAEETFTFEEMKNTWFLEETFEITIEFTRDATGQAEELLAIENQAFGQDRLSIGIDATDHPYLIYTNDCNVPAATYTTITADYTVQTGPQRITVGIDADGGSYFINNDGSSYIDPTAIPLIFAYSSKFGSTGSGNGQFVGGPAGIAINSAGNIYVSDGDRDDVQVFSSEGVFISKFGSRGTGDGQFQDSVGLAIDSSDNVWVCDIVRNDIQIFDSSGSFISKIGSYGTGNGEFRAPHGIAFDSSGLAYVTDSGNSRIQKFNSNGSYHSQFGTNGTGNGQFNTPIKIYIDSNDFLYIAESFNSRVQKLTTTGSYISKIGSYGTGNGQFDFPSGITGNSEGDIFVSDTFNDRLQKFTSGLAFVEVIGSSGSGDGQFSMPSELATTTSDGLWICDGANNRVQLFKKSLETFDISDVPGVVPGDDEKIIIGDGFEGDIFEVKKDDTMLLLDTSGGVSTALQDQVGDLDIPLVDGVFVAYLQTETITAFTKENPDPVTGEYTETVTELTILDEIIITTIGDAGDDGSGYSNPGDNQSNVALPLPYGNLIENSDADVWACPCADSVNFVYIVAGWPIQSVANGNVVTVWADGVLQTSGYTFDESNNYESKGLVAILNFTSDPGGSVTVRCNGKWVGGALLTNPVDIISDFMDYAAGLVGNAAWQKNTGSFAQGKAFCTAQNYTCAGVVLSNNTLGYWLKNILNSFAGTFSFDDSGKVKLAFLEMNDRSSVVESIIEYEATSAPVVRKNIENVVQRSLVNYARSTVEIDKRFKGGARDSYYRTSDITDPGAANKSYSGKAWPLDFDWTRNTATVLRIQNRILDLYSVPDWSVEYQGQDFKFLPVELLDQVSGTFAVIRDADGVIVQDKIFQVRHKTMNLDDFSTTLSLQGVGEIIEGDYVFFGDDAVYSGNARVIIAGV